jgi:glycosyltransferase involved in cell wall biosynthesis
VAALALRGLGGDRPKLVRTFHREEQPRSHPWTKWLARQTDGMIAISSSLGEQLRRTYRRTDGNLTVIGGVVDTEQFHRDEEGGAALRREWEIPEGAKVVGLLSRLREARGIFWLLDAVEPLLERVPGAVVVYCGRGRHAKLLRERIAEHPRKDRVRYPGYMTADQLNAAYSAFDVHCLLGPGNDGTCRAALQSMSCEVPLVAVDQGALHDMLQPQEGEASDAEMGGRLAAKNDVATLVDVLAEILTDGTLRDQMGHVARHRMETYFRPEQQAQAVLRWYNSLLEKR